mmetsp:Transcript_6120/g.8315  ORF Transcript_6120/g.8315 Transcript_6120/m.8315 type:complete len:307 (-) Transcript_6120:17-937(-)
MQYFLRFGVLASFLLLASATAPYVKNATDTKCAYQHVDRLYRLEDMDLEGCHQKCADTETCNYFSFADKGRYKGVCMGCTEGVVETHKHFDFYNMVPATTTTPAPGPTPAPPSGLSNVVDFPSEYQMNTKCAFEHPDRLYRVENTNATACWQLCLHTDLCNYFSHAEEGKYKDVCMGCTEGVTQPHHQFKFYKMPWVAEPIPNPAEICPVMPYSQRVDCGWWGVTPWECEAKGCCWQTDPWPNPNHVPWCYREYTSNPSCDMAHEVKTDCGFWGIGVTECESRGCCYRQDPNPNPENIPWCYFPSE